MIINYVPHEEVVIQHFTKDPELAYVMLDDAIRDGDIEEVRIIWRRLMEARRRLGSSEMVAAAMA